MKLYLLFFITLCCYAQIKSSELTTTHITTITNSEVNEFLVNSGYLEADEHHSRQAYRRALRLFQRENGLIVNGRITHEIREFIRKEKDRQYVLDYLKAFGYIQGAITPHKTAEAIRQVQINSGELKVTGTITQETVHFLKSRTQSLFEPIQLNY